MARLVALDDGRKSGQRFRLRRDTTTIGRGHADIEIGHDHEISECHARIVRRWKDGQYRWLLYDLDSTNGSFVRVARSRLRNGQSLLIGTRRFRLQSACRPENDSNLSAGECDGAHATLRFRPARAISENSSESCIVEQSPVGQPLSMSLAAPQCVWGKDEDACQLAIKDDPFVDPCHAKFVLDEYDRWYVEDLESVNGIWVQVQRARLRNGTQFQLGEQRFVFRAD